MPYINPDDLFDNPRGKHVKVVDEAEIKALVPLLQSEGATAQEVETAFRKLLRLGSPLAVRPLIQFMVSNPKHLIWEANFKPGKGSARPDVGNIIQLTDMLFMSEEHIADLIVSALRKQSDFEEWQVITLLSLLSHKPHPSAAEAVAQLLQDERVKIRRIALEILGKLGLRACFLI